MGRVRRSVNLRVEAGLRMINALAAEALPALAASPVVLMVSGGSDSTALLVRAACGELDLADGLGPRRIDPARLAVFHVNHCLRGSASDADEAFVCDLAGHLGIPVHVLRADIPAMLADGGNMEETARLVRYEGAWELAGELAERADVDRRSARILVAHTADDRVETFLMRVAQGAGSSGLTGMRQRRGIVVRPLLGETRAGLRAYLEAQGIGWREDATNEEDVALRSYVRHHVVPALVARNPALHATLGRTLDVLADEDDLLGRMAARELDALVRESCSGTVVFDGARLASCEPALARRAVRLGLEHLLGSERFRLARFEGRHVEALLELARRGEGACTLPLALDARMDHGALVVQVPEEAGSSLSSCSRSVSPLGLDFCSHDTREQTLCYAGQDLELAVPGRIDWYGGEIYARYVDVPPNADARAFARDLASGEGLVQGRDFVLVDAAALGPEPRLWVGPPRAGERMRPFGLGGSKLVSDVVSEARVPLRDRPRVPVVRVCDEAGATVVVWVGGIRLDDRAAYRPTTRVLVELTFLGNPALSR